MVGLMQQQPLLPAWLLEAQLEVGEGSLESVSASDSEVLPQVLRGARPCDPPPREELKTLSMPSLLLAWVEDASHPLTTAEELDGLLPESQLVVARVAKDVLEWPVLNGIGTAESR
jgi:hypothetical protein